ncbi:hypothetical protein AUJ14_01705 [Candidatus Micrarchaeota archaeon CG1_02_55_22]|nr:MAG: hypothetical protein AUJ14_01705 [Candidatus Micrarchaeota archaeon CG1_02_55_22]
MEMEESPLSQMGPILDKVKSLLPVLVVLAVLVIAAFWYLSLPKPGTVNVTVKQIDGESINGVLVTLTNAQGNEAVPPQITLNGGRATFANVPGGADYTVMAQPLPGYTDPAPQIITLASGASETAILELGKNAPNIKLALDAESQKAIGALTANCVQPIIVKISNAGTDAYQAELVTGPNDKQAEIVLDQTSKDVLSGEEVAVTGKILVGGVVDEYSENAYEKQMSIRIKGTAGPDTNIPVDLKITSTTKLELDTTTISVSQREPYTQFINLQNTGAKPITNLGFKLQLDPQLTNLCGEDGGGCITLEWPAGSNGQRVDTLFQSDTMQVGIKINPPSSTGKYLAHLLFTATCLNNPGKDVTIQLDVPEPQA